MLLNFLFYKVNPNPNSNSTDLTPLRLTSANAEAATSTVTKKPERPSIISNSLILETEVTLNLFYAPIS